MKVCRPYFNWKLMHDVDDDDGDDEKCKSERSFRGTDVDTFEVYRRVRGASEDPLLPAGGRLLLC